MRVGIIHYGLDRQATGIGRYTRQLTAALKSAGVAVVPLWAGAVPDASSGRALIGAYRLPGLLTVGQLAVARLAQRLCLDVVHDPTGVMPLSLTRAKRITTIHDAIPFIYPQTSTLLDRLIYRLWLPLVLRCANAIITDSEQSMKDISTHLPVAADHITKVSPASDRRFRPVERDVVEAACQRYGIDKPYILYVGALESRKNLPRLLEAYARLLAWSGEWRLVIVGARKWKYSPIFDTVQRLALEPHVHFTGYVADEDLPALYSGAALFTFPSLYEGFGLPVLEAMACGTPVVTSFTSSLPEVAGDAALLVDPYDVDAISDAMRLILSDQALAAELRQKGIRRSAQFSWERTANETLAVYERVLAKAR